jgi:hypothetical protein
MSRQLFPSLKVIVGPCADYATGPARVRFLADAAVEAMRPAMVEPDVAGARGVCDDEFPANGWMFCAECVCFRSALG